MDKDLLEAARAANEGRNDASLIDSALTALVAQQRAMEIDEGYARAYEEHPIDEAGDWGTLASFREAAASS